MSDGKPFITSIPFRGRSLNVAEGMTCAVHKLVGQAKLDALLAGLHGSPEGIDICSGCLTACKDFILQKRREQP